MPVKNPKKKQTEYYVQYVLEATDDVPRDPATGLPYYVSLPAWVIDGRLTPQDTSVVAALYYIQQYVTEGHCPMLNDRELRQFARCSQTELDESRNRLKALGFIKVDGTKRRLPI